MARAYAENQRRLSELAATNFGMSALRLSDLISIGIGPASSIRDLQLASASTAVANIVADRAKLFEHTKLAGGLMAYAGVQSALWNSPNALLGGVSFAPSRRLDAYLDSLGVRPSARRADLAGAASFAASGLMTGEVLLTPHRDHGDLQVVGADADEDVASPWRQGLAGLQADLYDELSRIDPVIPELLKGAWVDVAGDGPAAVTKVATCLVEAIDVTLRGLCKGADLSGWLMEQGLKGDRYIANGHPTRAARATFAVRMRSRRDRQLVRAMEDGVVRQLVVLMSAVEGPKHEPIVISVAASGIRALTVSTESLLVQLLGL